MPVQSRESLGVLTQAEQEKKPKKNKQLSSSMAVGQPVKRSFFSTDRSDVHRKSVPDFFVEIGDEEHTAKKPYRPQPVVQNIVRMNRF